MRNANRNLDDPTGYFDNVPKDKAGAYLLNLRQAAWLAINGERTAATIALTRLMLTLVGYYRTGWLAIAPDAPTEDHEVLAVEVFTAFL